MTTVFAPGHYIPAAWPDNNTKTISGTSMASPVVAGAIAIIQQAATDIIGRKLNYDEVTKILQDNGKNIFDGSIEYKRIDIEKVVAEIVNIQKPGFHKINLKAGDKIKSDFGFTSNNESLAGMDSGETNLTVVGTSSNDSIEGSSGNDHIIAGSGNDFVKGNGGKDTLNLGAGNDVALISGSGSIVTVGEGNDTLVLAVDARDIEINDFAGASKGTLSVYKKVGTKNNDDLSGTLGATDVILAGSGDDLIYGFDCADILMGQDGKDTVFGGKGNDFIFAGAGSDKLDGGEGEDSFVFDLAKIRDGDLHQIENFDLSADSIYLMFTEFDEKPILANNGNNLLVSYKGKKVVQVNDLSTKNIKAEDIHLATAESFSDIEDTIHFDIV